MMFSSVVRVYRFAVYGHRLIVMIGDEHAHGDDGRVFPEYAVRLNGRVIMKGYDWSPSPLHPTRGMDAALDLVSCATQDWSEGNDAFVPPIADASTRETVSLWVGDRQNMRDTLRDLHGSRSPLDIARAVLAE